MGPEMYKCWSGGSRGSAGYETGITSQWARKCSPRTELYGLQTFPRWTPRRVTADSHMRLTGCAYDELEIFRKGKPQSGKHTLKQILRVVDAVLQGPISF